MALEQLTQVWGSPTKKLREHIASAIAAHTNRKDNPHNTTKAQVGLSNVPNYTFTTSVSDSSTTKFASASAVKQAYDLANSKITKAQADGWYLGRHAKADDSDKLDGLDSTQFVRTYRYKPTGLANRYVKICSIGKTDCSVSFILDGLGDCNSTKRGTLMATFASKDSVADCRAYALNRNNTSDYPTIHIKNAGTHFELWGYFSDNNPDLNLVVTHYFNTVEIAFNAATTALPSGCSTVSLTDIYTTSHKPSKADIGLRNVPNWVGTSAVDDPSDYKFATAGAVKKAYDLANSRMTKAEADGLYLGQMDKAVNAGYSDYLLAPTTMRDVKPNTTGISTGRSGVKAFFASGSGLGIGGSYSDLLILDTYHDTGGGKPNAIAFSKSTKAMYHLQPDFNGESWGVADKIYTTAQRPTKAEVGLGNVPNYGISDSLTNNSSTSFASSKAVYELKLLVNALDNSSGGTLSALDAHKKDKSNPHGVTKAQVGLGSVNNWGASASINNTSDTTYSTAGAVKKAYDRANVANARAEQAEANAKAYADARYNQIMGGAPASALDTIKELADRLLDESDALGTLVNQLSTHTNNQNNPHGVTKAQVGLGSVNNWGATGATNNASDTLYATAGAVKKAYDLAASKMTQATGDGRYAYKAGSTGQDFAVRKLTLGAGSSDNAWMMATVSGSSTFFDSYLADDPAQDKFRWLFASSGDKSDDNLSNAAHALMTLEATSVGANKARLNVYGEIYAGVGNNRVYHVGNRPTKAEIGLSNVPNYIITGATNDPSDTKFATAGAVKKAYDLAASKMTQAVADGRYPLKAGRHHGFFGGGLIIQDTRGVNRAPNYYQDQSVRFDFTEKANSANVGDSWHTLMTIVPWTTHTAQSHRGTQLAFTGGSGIKMRIATSETAWSGWYDVYTSLNRPSKTDVGLSNVPNYTFTTSVSDSSTTKFAAASAVKQAYDRGTDGINKANAAQTKANQAYDLAASKMTQAAGDGRYAPKSHTHSMTNISDRETHTPEYASGLGTIDLDTLKTNAHAGFYYQHANSNATSARHYPINLAGTLIVTIGAGVTQTYIPYYSNSRIYTRGYYGSSWSAWRAAYDTVNKPTKSDVGLSNVPNYTFTTSVSDSSTSKFASASAVKSAYDRGTDGINRANNAQTKANQAYDLANNAANRSIDNRNRIDRYIAPNLLDNPSFEVFSRGLSSKTHGTLISEYSADRWYVQNARGWLRGINRPATPNGSIRSLVVVRNIQDDTMVIQRIIAPMDGTYRLVDIYHNREFTFSCWCYCDDDNVRLEHVMWSTPDYSESGKIISTSVALKKGRWVRVEGTARINMTSGKGNYLQIRLDFVGGSKDNHQVTIADCKFEEMPYATPFRRNLPSFDRLICSAYYYKTIVRVNAGMNGQGNIFNYLTESIRHPVPLIGNPTIRWGSGDDNYDGKVRVGPDSHVVGIRSGTIGVDYFHLWCDAIIDRDVRGWIQLWVEVSAEL